MCLREVSITTRAGFSELSVVLATTGRRQHGRVTRRRLLGLSFNPATGAVPAPHNGFRSQDTSANE